MVVHGIDPAAGDLRPGVCLSPLGKLFSYQEINPTWHLTHMKHLDIRWNRETEEWYCASCGRTSDHIKKEDALVELEQFECELPTATRAKKNQDPTG